LKIRGKHTFEQLDGYDNSLSKGVDFRRFFEWFREREDTENESTNDQIEFFLKSIEEDEGYFKANNEDDFWSELQKHKASAKDRQLSAVRKAIESFMDGFTNIKIKRKPRLHMAIDKNGQTLNVSQLSQGEKSLMALVGDIARRLAMMNPALTNPLEGDGVVLIDEVDMHLHPKWARDIIANLTKTFPNCQFILTTHSPLVISDSKDILVYALDDGELKQKPSQYGQDANTVLLEVMGTNFRNDKVAKQLQELNELIQDRNLEEAQNKLEALQKELHEDNVELRKAKWLLRKEEIRHAKNPEEK
jgi:predicted ATP-binding protein involved in virulence